LPLDPSMLREDPGWWTLQRRFLGGNILDFMSIHARGKTPNHKLRHYLPSPTISLPANLGFQHDNDPVLDSDNSRWLMRRPKKSTRKISRPACQTVNRGVQWRPHLPKSVWDWRCETLWQKPTPEARTLLHQCLNSCHQPNRTRTAQWPMYHEATHRYLKTHYHESRSSHSVEEEPSLRR
jgi:hypothetical protein